MQTLLLNEGHPLKRIPHPWLIHVQICGKRVELKPLTQVIEFAPPIFLYLSCLNLMLRWRTLVADILCFPKYNVDAAQGSIMHFDSDLHCLWRCPLQFNRRRLPWSQSTNSYNKNQIKNIRRHNGKARRNGILRRESLWPIATQNILALQFGKSVPEFDPGASLALLHHHIRFKVNGMPLGATSFWGRSCKPKWRLRDSDLRADILQSGHRWRRRS